MTGIKAQILVTTLILITIITLTIVGITVTVQRSANRLTSNIGYEYGYSLAEDSIVNQAVTLSDIELETATDYEQVFSADPNFDYCSSGISGQQYITCAFTDVDGWRTIQKIQTTNEVTNYSLESGESFNINLDTQGAGSLNEQIEISWLGNSALDLKLIYEDSNSELANIQTVARPNVNNTFTNFSNTQDIPFSLSSNSTRHTVTINTNSINVPNQKVLRITPVNRGNPLVFDIRPQQGNLPDQVKLIETISYNTLNVSTPAPTVEVQFPLLPNLPAPIFNSSTFSALSSPTCGNGVQEAGESCDDGNNIDDDDCTNQCLVRFSNRYSFDGLGCNWRGNCSGCAGGDRIDTQTYSLPLDRKPSNLQILAPPQTIYYDDHFLLMINDIIVAGSFRSILNSAEERTYSGRQVYRYTGLDSIYRQRFEGGTFCVESTTCKIPETQSNAEFSVEFTKEFSDVLAQSVVDNNFNITLTIVTFGDDDPSIDCDLNMDVNVEGYL